MISSSILFSIYPSMLATLYCVLSTLPRPRHFPPGCCWGCVLMCVQWRCLLCLFMYGLDLLYCGFTIFSFLFSLILSCWCLSLLSSIAGPRWSCRLRRRCRCGIRATLWSKKHLTSSPKRSNRQERRKEINELTETIYKYLESTSTDSASQEPPL